MLNRRVLEGLNRISQNRSGITKRIFDPVKINNKPINPKLVTEYSNNLTSVETSKLPTVQPKRVENFTQQMKEARESPIAKQEHVNAPLPRPKETSDTPVQDALGQTGAEDFSHLALKNKLSPAFQGTVEYALQRVVDMRSSRAFSTSSGDFSDVKRPADEKDAKPNSTSVDRWPPKSLADIGPVGKLKKGFDERHEEIWMKILNAEARFTGIDATKENYKKTCDKLTKIASDDLKGSEICRRFTAQELLEALKSGSFQSTHQKQECAGSDLDSRQLTYIAKLQLALGGYSLDTPASERPLHAIATKDRFGEFDNHYLDDFGEVAFFFDPKVIKVANVIGGDSLVLVNQGNGELYSMQIDACPQPLEKPTYRIFPLQIETRDIYDLPVMTTWDPRTDDKHRSKKFRYYEVHLHRILAPQMLGQSTLGPQDGTRAVIGDPVRIGKETTLRLKTELEKYGILCDVGKNKKDSLNLRAEHNWIREHFPLEVFRLPKYSALHGR